MTARLEVNGVSRSFPGVMALDCVSLDLEPGEVHALVGENGAGKSTLIKIIAGALAPDSGGMTMDGKPYRPKDPAHAVRAGVSAIHQERNVLPDRSVAFNIVMGREPRKSLGRLDLAAVRARSAQALAELGASDMPLDTRAGGLSTGQRQVIEIARALVMECSVLIMDEPTSALSGAEREALFRVVERLKEKGVAVLYVSHRLEEIFKLADRVTVLRDGRRVRTSRVGEVTADALVSDMIGREWKGAFPKKRPDLGGVRLSVRGLSAKGAFHEVSFELMSGEVLGLAGLSGSGKEELGRALFGAHSLDAGEIVFEGEPFIPSPAESIIMGVAYIPDDRKAEGVILDLPLARNISLPSLSRMAGSLGNFSLKAEHFFALSWSEKLEIKAPDLTVPCATLSGGNQQKTSLAKWLASDASLFIFSHPTQEIDVAVKFELYGHISDLSRDGASVIIISSEFPELMGLCHRILVMKDGKVSAELKGDAADPESIMRAAIGREA